MIDYKIATWGVLALLIQTSVAFADWKLGEPHKMHFPQLPDPQGWDVATASVPSDDWKCTQSGSVTDLHFWYSWREDREGEIDMIQTEIRADDRTGEFSKPGALLWRGQFLPSQFTVRLAGEGDQGFYNPNIEDPSIGIRPNDHKLYYQANIEQIADPFVQEEGSIYWLSISIPHTGGAIGWKTSQDSYEDAAVYFDLDTDTYRVLVDPLTQETLSLAFVITGIPEPATSWMAAVVAVWLVIGCRKCWPFS